MLQLCVVAYLFNIPSTEKKTFFLKSFNSDFRNLLVRENNILEITKPHCNIINIVLKNINFVGHLNLSFQYCHIFMESAFNDYKMCVANVTQLPAGMTYNEVCGAVRKRATTKCRSCCADGGCNYGTCTQLNGIIFCCVCCCWVCCCCCCC